MDGGNIKDALALMSRLKEEEDPTPIYLEERAKTIEVLENFDIYGMEGLVLYADGIPVAFSIGEAKGDTLYIHIEKSDASFRGAPQMIASRYVQLMANDDIVYVNREEDLGDPGLRKSKLAYHPVEVIEKYTLFAV
jgi:hypothetical protein